MVNVDKYYLTAIFKYTRLNVENGIANSYSEVEKVRIACVSEKYLTSKNDIFPEKVYVDLLTGQQYQCGINCFRDSVGTEFVYPKVKLIPLNLLIEDEKLSKRQLVKKVRSVVIKMNKLLLLEKEEQKENESKEEIVKIKKI